MDLEERWKKYGKRKDERNQDKEWRLGYRIVDDGRGRSPVSVLGCTSSLKPRVRPQESTLVRHIFFPLTECNFSP